MQTSYEVKAAAELSTTMIILQLKKAGLLPLLRERDAEQIIQPEIERAILRLYSPTPVERLENLSRLI